MRVLLPRIASIGILVAGLGVMSGCSATPEGEPQGPASSTTNVTTTNQQDAVFAKQLIQLSEQLVEITDILIAKTDDPAVAAKLEQLGRTANERIQLGNRWLQMWARTGVDAPPAPGILTEQQSDALIESSGAPLKAAITVAAESQLSGTLAISAAEVDGGENSAAMEVARQLKDRSAAELALLNQFQQ